MTRGANRALKGARGATPTRRVELQQVPECVLGKELAPRVIAYAGRISWWVTKRGQSFVSGCLRNRRRKGGNSQALCSLSLSLFSFSVVNQSFVREGEERKGGLPAVGVSSRVSQPTGGLRSGPAGRGRHGYTAAIELPQPTKLGREGNGSTEGAALQSLLDSGIRWCCLFHIVDMQRKFVLCFHRRTRHDTHFTGPVCHRAAKTTRRIDTL